MPTYKKKIYTKKKTYKKPYKKSVKAFGNSLVNVPRTTVNMGLGFPKQMLVKQKYMQTVILTSDTGILTHYAFRLNSLFDPDLSGTGHQPMYFDQYMAIYNHYHVIGAKVRVRFIAREANTTPMTVALCQNDDSVFTHGNIDNIAEQSKSNVKILGSGGDSTVILNHNYSTKKTFGGSVLSNVSLRGDASFNPSETSILEICAQSTDLTTTVCVAQVYIEYISVYAELKDVGAS